MKTLFIILLALFLGRFPVSYEKSAVVILVDYPADEVTVIDDSGELWAFYGAEDWQVWDRCQLAMNDNGTPGNVYDDLIVAVTYMGSMGLEDVLEVMGK